MKTIALVNQKGGVGKTASTASLGIGLVQEKKKVLPEAPVQAKQPIRHSF